VTRLLDATRDGRVDLVVRCAVPQAEALLAIAGGVQPLGLRYGAVEGTFYLVPDIFRLGPPIAGKVPLF
jgi:hypothetical protein